MNRLNELADELTVIRGAIGNVGRHWSAEAVKVIGQTESLLRAAAAETVGTEDAARLAVADARKERDEARIERDENASMYLLAKDERDEASSARQRAMSLYDKAADKNAALQRAIDEAYGLAYKAVYNEERNDLLKVYDILRPHATQREGTKADATPAPADDTRELVARLAEIVASLALRTGNPILQQDTEMIVTAAKEGSQR